MNLPLRWEHQCQVAVAGPSLSKVRRSKYTRSGDPQFRHHRIIGTLTSASGCLICLHFHSFLVCDEVGFLF
ncbi:hypothetical protein KC19_1G025900 [Ceratodon purpureus]|uniref:Uncharacterized protein n=1 Tax=Ceratodon purpureus TaxID=3225 RepID=A0A8T0J1T8_CERPU|nr:hypothetical protein KC19_1G025900 [Ceratodon purpureus]